MELIFVRHGHGEHLMDYPNKLNTLHPGLTDHGKQQIMNLREQFVIYDDDLIVVSPTRRTIETAEILTQGYKFYVSPCVGPRMYPQNPEYEQLRCDQIYNISELAGIMDITQIIDFDMNIWENGINRMEQSAFEEIARKFLQWCKNNAQRTIIISHDGTITNYRVVLGEKNLTRGDFLGEAGVYKVGITSDQRRT